MANLYTEVTQRILQQLEAGTVPWVKPWSATAGNNIPHNASTGRPYSGANVILLWMAAQSRAFKTLRFMTYRQAQSLGANVRKGEHGYQVVFVKPMTGKRSDDDDSEKTPRGFMMLKSYTVFNVDQIEGLPSGFLQPNAVKARHDDERDATIDEFIAATKADFREGHGGDRAYYTPAGDFVAMPAFEAFHGAKHFYGTAFHELSHWTGNAKRLDRTFGKRFGDRAYAAEELVAELSAAFLSAEFGVDGMLQHNAAYLANWCELLKDDPKAFFTAASAAQKAADYLRAQILSEDSQPLEMAA